MQKVPGVTSVRVSLNEGLTVLDFKADNTVTLAQLRQVIRNNGFVTREAKVVASGTVATSGNDLTFEVAGSRERYAVRAATNELRAKMTVSTSAPLVVTGTVDITDPKSMKMTVTAVEQWQR